MTQPDDEFMETLMKAMTEPIAADSTPTHRLECFKLTPEQWEALKLERQGVFYLPEELDDGV